MGSPTDLDKNNIITTSIEEQQKILAYINARCSFSRVTRGIVRQDVKISRL
jgi:hypothetical protein